VDETLPAPWEWDVKRLAASFVIASRHNGFSVDDARDAALRCVRSYREHMAELSEMSFLDVWYAAMDVERLMSGVDKDTQKRARRRLAKARERTVLEHDFPQLPLPAGLPPPTQDNPPPNL